MAERSLFDTHMHTPLCRHAEGEPAEYARAGWQRGLRGIVFTCHNPMPEDYGHDGRMADHEMEVYVAMVASARDLYAGRLEVGLGLECDFFPGYENHLERQLRGRSFDYVLGSIHPFLPIWRRGFGDRHPVEQQRLYFEQLADAAETRLFDSLSHPDLIKNQTKEDWNLSRILDSVRASLDRIAATGVALELNTSGAIKRLPEMNPGPQILAEMRRRGIPVTLGSDAHVPQRVADRFEEALALLETVGYREVSYFRHRCRHEVAIERARQALGDPRHDPSAIVSGVPLG